MEIQESTSSIFYVGRAFALAPYVLRRNAKGIINDYKFSLMLCLYSVTVTLTLVLLTIRGIVNDANSKYPVRMTTATSKFVTSFDVCIVVVACLSGVGCGLFGLRHTHEMNAKLRERLLPLSDYLCEIFKWKTRNKLLSHFQQIVNKHITQ